LINAIILNDKLRENIIPYRLVQKWLTPDLNSFILLSNQGCFPIINSKAESGSKMVFEIMSDAEMDKITPEFDHMEDHGATLAIDVKISPDNTHRYTCVGYEDGYCSLSIVEITETGQCILKKKSEKYYSSTISSILFINSSQLLISPMWEGVVFYPDVLNGFGNAEFVENSNKFDAVTSLCNSKRLGGLDSGTGFCVGTFGKRLLVYSIENKGSGNCCKLKWDRKFRYPILQLRSFDITGDGLQDIAVLSSGGLHLLQVNYRLVIQKLIRQIENEKKLDISDEKSDSENLSRKNLSSEPLPETLQY